MVGIGGLGGATAVVAALIFYVHPTGMLLMVAEFVFVLGLIVDSFGATSSLGLAVGGGRIVCRVDLAGHFNDWVGVATARQLDVGQRPAKGVFRCRVSRIAADVVATDSGVG